MHLAWAAINQAFASLLGNVCHPGGRGCPSLLALPHISNVWPPLALVAGSGVGVAEASAEATAG